MAMRSVGIKFAAAVILLETAFVLIIGLLANYSDAKWGSNEYPNFQDVNAMIFVGFGFLMTFLKRYGYSGVGLNLFISAICIQWTFIVRGLIHKNGDDFTIGVGDMVSANFGTATVLISFGAVLGKTSPLQLLVMGLIEVAIAQANQYIGLKKLHAVDIGESMFIHMFGAYFGMAVAFVLYNPDIKDNSKEGSVYHSDLFSIVGTLFLWIYWPSFNGGFAGSLSQIAYINTFLSLCCCTAVAFAVSALLDGESKFDMVHVQNSTLAGGVAVGACANMPMEPYAAMLIGGAAGLISVVGYKFITPCLSSKVRIHDTCGVHNLHGMPGVLAAIATAILCGTFDVDDWGDRINEIFTEIKVENGTLIGRDKESQAGYQIAAAGITLAMAVGGGLVTGIILKLPIWDAPKEEELFDDEKHWSVPNSEQSPLAGTGYKSQTNEGFSPDITPM